MTHILGIGFPRGCPIPANVSACGDGIHTDMMIPGIRNDCACNRMEIDLRRLPHLPRPLRVVLAGASMDGTDVGEIRRISGRLVRP